MSIIEAYEKFCGRITEAALRREKISVTVECNGISCSGMYRVEPIMEDDEFIEIIAGDANIVIEKTPFLIASYNEAENTYIISNGIFRCIIM